MLFRSKEMHLMVKTGPVWNAKIFCNLVMITDDKKIILCKGQFLLSFSLYLTLMILIFSTYFGIFPLDYRLTGVKLALIVFYKFCIELNVIHGLWIVPRKVQIKLWSTLASLWNSNPNILQVRVSPLSGNENLGQPQCPSDFLQLQACCRSDSN